MTAPSRSFWRTYVFSTDHKVIGVQQFYNQLGAMHGTIMIFLGVVPLATLATSGQTWWLVGMVCIITSLCRLFLNGTMPGHEDMIDLIVGLL